MTSSRPNGFWAFLGVFGRGINVLRLVIINVVFFGLLLIVGLLLFGGLAGGAGRAIQGDSVLVLKPEGRLVDQFSVAPIKRVISSLSGNEPKEVRLRDLIGSIDAAAHDKRITRILLLPDELQSGGFASLREVGAALDRFRAAGKPVIVWGVNFDQGQFYLAAHADRILVDPQGGLMLTGLANYRLYYKDLLDKLGVDVHLFRVGQFKSAAEPYVLDHASPQAKEADRFWMNGLWDEYLAEVAGLRKLSAATLRDDIDNLPEKIASTNGDLAQLALNEHLVDGLATRAQVESMMRKEGVPAGRHDDSFRQVDMDRYVAQLTDRSDGMRSGGVAIVVAQGEISGGSQGPGSIGGETTAALIRAARRNPATKALVLRVNSPGGEVYAAEEIRRQVALTRQAGIPVVVSMGDVAASGGYWISMNANRILAEPNTITGSIGIFGMYYSVPGTLAKLGVTSDGVSTGPMAGAYDITRPLDPKVGTVIQAIIDRGYHDFVSKVAEARGNSYDGIDAIAQGRVWTGRQALARGLVDQLGGLDAAVADAASLAKLGKNYPVRYIEQPLGTLGRFMLNMQGSAMVQVAQSYGLHLPGWMAQLPALMPEWTLLRKARAGKANIYADCLCAPR